MNSIDIQMAKNTMDKVFEELEFWIKRSMPKHGEVWVKEPCGRGMCRIGWSFGVGTYMIDKTQNWSYDAIDAIKCGCLHRVTENIDDIRQRERDAIIALIHPNWINEYPPGSGRDDRYDLALLDVVERIRNRV